MEFKKSSTLRTRWSIQSAALRKLKHSRESCFSRPAKAIITQVIIASRDRVYRLNVIFVMFPPITGYFWLKLWPFWSAIAAKNCLNRDAGRSVDARASENIILAPVSLPEIGRRMARFVLFAKVSVLTLTSRSSSRCSRPRTAWH